VGVKKITHEEFNSRCWEEHKEALGAYASDLQNMASTLKIPIELVKARFIEGLPTEIKRQTRPLLEDGDSLERHVKVAEKIVRCKADTPVCTVSDRLENNLQTLMEEVAALKTKYAKSDDRFLGKCYNCGKSGYQAKQCCAKTKCFTCGLRIVQKTEAGRWIDRPNSKHNCGKF